MLLLPIAKRICCWLYLSLSRRLIRYFVYVCVLLLTLFYVRVLVLAQIGFVVVAAAANFATIFAKILHSTFTWLIVNLHTHTHAFICMGM